MAQQLLENLITQFNTLGLIISINGGDQEKIHDLLINVNPKIKNNILFIVEELPSLKEIFTKSDVFIRPTNTDGDAVSVQEAIYYGTTSIASDVAPRPKECLLFKTRDIDDLTLKTKGVLEKIVDNKEEAAEKTKPKKNNGDRIIDIYKKYMGT